MGIDAARQSVGIRTVTRAVNVVTVRPLSHCDAILDLELGRSEILGATNKIPLRKADHVIVFEWDLVCDSRLHGRIYMNLRKQGTRTRSTQSHRAFSANSHTYFLKLKSVRKETTNKIIAIVQNVQIEILLPAPPPRHGFELVTKAELNPLCSAKSPSEAAQFFRHVDCLAKSASPLKFCDSLWPFHYGS